MKFRGYFLKGYTFFILFVLFCSGCKETNSTNQDLISKDKSLKNITLSIGLIPEQNVLEQMKRYKPLGDYIEKMSSIKIKFTLLSRYGNIINTFNRLKLDGAFWGSFTGAMAIKKLGVVHIARPVNLDGTSSYRGYIFVHKKSKIKNIKNMRNKIIAFVDKATTAGYIFPIAYFKENRITKIRKYFRELYFTGSHDAAVHDVLNGKADIGCAKNTIFDIMALNDPKIKEQLIILQVSEDFPSNGLGLRRDLHPDIKDRLKKTLLNMDKVSEGQKVLKKFNVLKFIETTEKDYLPVFDVASKSGINLKNYIYDNK